MFYEPLHERQHLPRSLLPSPAIEVSKDETPQTFLTAIVQAQILYKRLVTMTGVHRIRLQTFRV